MPWVVTLQINSCASASTHLGGATINDGFNLYYADSNGQFIAVVDDAYTGYVVQISKSGYTPRNFALSNTQNGTIQTTCLNVAPPPPPGGGGGGISCFIVTAATGSAQSDEVVALRQLRDRVAATSGLGARLIDKIYNEYERFSPALAERIEGDKLARQGALWVIVKPLVAWYGLAGKLAFDGADAASTAGAVKDLANACPRYLGPASIASMLDSLRNGQALPASAPQLVHEFAPRLREAAGMPFASWAILDALVRAWNTAAQRLDAREQVAEWLSAAPIEKVARPADELMAGELKSLASMLAFDANARRRLGGRLVQAWPDVAAALADARFVPSGGD